MKSLLVMLLYLGLGGTVMALGLMLTRRLLGRRLPGSFYYYAWLVVLLRFTPSVGSRSVRRIVRTKRS